MLLKKLLQSVALVAFVAQAAHAADIQLLNVSYDPTRELYQDINQAFAQQWKQKSGGNVKIKQSHGGSGKQARTVIDGLDADVVTLGLAYDIDEIAERGLIAKDWQKRLPGNSTPYSSTIVERGIGDVLIAWENEALLAIKELGPDKVEVVVPPQSILAEPPVAVVDKVVDKHGTRKVAEAYLQYLYTDDGQEIIAKHYYRPTVEKAAKKYAAQFPKVQLFTINDIFGGWTKAQKAHFADGGTFDQIYQPGKH